jgi:hypothetical protein
VSWRYRWTAARQAWKRAGDTSVPGPVKLPTGCAFGDCLSAGRDEHMVPIPGDYGTTWFLFCSLAHKLAWLDDLGITDTAEVRS